MRLRVVALAAVAMMLVPSVSAAPLDSALRLDVVGAASIDAAADAIFLMAGDEGFSWEATAASVKLERTWCDKREVRSQEVPVVGGRTPGYVTCVAEPRTETIDFTDARLQGLATPLGGALLAMALTQTPLLRVDAPQGLSVVPEKEPRADQAGGPPSVDEGDAVDWEIHEALPGPTLNLTTKGSVIELRGTFLLRPSWVTYRIFSPQGVTDARTGEWRESEDAAVTEGRAERHVLLLEDAVLTLRTSGDAHVFAAAPTVALDGLVTAEGAGDLAKLGLVPDEGGAWRGATTLTLGFDGGRVALAPATVLQQSGAMRAARTPALLAWGVGALALVAAAVAVVAMRRRRDEGDALELALLAMEEHRFGDALPHLERALRERPDDADLLVDRALCLEETGQLNDARDGYEAALRAQPFNAETHYYYARTLARLRNSTAALAHLSRALSMDARLGELARQERAFAAFRDHPQFIGLLG